ncbi:MAG: hypothetical protein ABIH86_07370 [Planctomycetota bacterium]
MIDKLNIRFHRLVRCAGDSEWYWMIVSGGTLSHEATFPKYGAQEAQGLGPRGTVVSGRPLVRLGQLLSHPDIDGKIITLAIIEGELDPAEREVISMQIANLIGFDMEPDWSLTIFENCRQTYTMHSKPAAENG